MSEPHTGSHADSNQAGNQAAKAPPQMLRGDLTQGPILRTLIMFSIPMLMSNVLQSLNGTINSIWVGRLIGEEALAATANANMVMFLVSSAAFGFGMAGTVRIGQRYGSRNLDGARRTFGTAVGFCGILGLLIAVIGYFSAAPLLTMLGTPGEAYHLALEYLRVVFITMPVIMVTVIVTMAMRGAGDARTPLIFMLVAVVLDVGLNPFFIAGIGPFPELGITGSGVAMLIANVISLIGLLTYTYAKDLPLRLRGLELSYLRPRGDELRYIVSKGFPMGAQMLIMSAAGIIMIGLVNHEGLLMSAAYGAALQLFTYVQMPAMAIGGAVSSMAAQYIGARKWDLLDQVSRAGVLINVIITGTMALLTVVFDIPLLGLFLGSGSEALPLAAHIMLLASWNFIFFGVTMVYSGTMRAGGAVWMPLLIVVVALYPARIGFYYLSYDWLGSDAIWWSFSVGGVVATLLALFLYHGTNWRQRAQAEAAEEAQEQANADGDPAGRITPSI